MPNGSSRYGWEKLRNERFERTKDKRAKHAQYQKERRERLIQEGICVSCATDKAIPGHTMCDKCREIHNLKRRGIKQGYRPQTKFEPTPEQKEKYAQRKRERRLASKERGICAECHKEKAEDGKTLCAQCRERKNLSRRGKPRKPLTPEQKARQYEYMKEWRNRKREEGICYHCGKEKALPGLKVCRVCRAYINEMRSGYVEHSLKWWKKERVAGRL